MTTNPLVLILVCLLAWIALDYQGDQLASARQDLERVQSDLATAQESARQDREKQTARDDIDKQRTEELNRAQAENLRLQRDIADGRRRLLVKAICPAAVPGAAGATRLDDAGTAELAADARPDYFTLRSELIQSREMLLGLQDYIRQVVQRTPAQP